MPLLLEGTTAACPVSWGSWVESWETTSAVWGCESGSETETGDLSPYLAGSPIGLEETGLNLFLD